MVIWLYANNSGYIWLYDGIIAITSLVEFHLSTKLCLVGGIPTPLKNDGVRQWEG